MSVIVKKQGAKNFELMVKGAPEKIEQLCDPRTVLQAFKEIVHFYTKQGNRLLALAGRKLNDDLNAEDLALNISREDLEQDLVLYGLVVMQNQVKEATYRAIAELQSADIRTVMITGDNLQTALFVAKDVNIIREKEQIIQVVVQEIESSLQAAKHLKITFTDPFEDVQMLGARNPRSFRPVHGGDYVFCIDGPSFNYLYSQDQQLLEKVLVRGRVFARMLPEQKVQLIEALQGLGHQVMMCGDGCNDCGALKAAHAGISLSMADASVAAPFTSNTEDISCVPYLIKEGRASSSAAFSAFQYGAVVSFTGFAAVLIMYSVSTEPSDLQYSYWSDGHFVLPFLALGNIAPWPILVKRRPPRRLMAVLPMMTIFSFLLWQILVFVIGWTYCHAQPWFEPFVYEPNMRPPNPSYDETTVWQLMLMSCIAAAVTVTSGPPYAKHIMTNKIFSIWMVLAICLTTAAFFCRDYQFVYDLNLKQAPHVQYSGVVYLLGISGIVFCYFWERFFLRGLIYQHLMPFLESIRGPKEAFEIIESEIKANPSWPPMGKIEEKPHIDLSETGESNDFDDAAEKRVDEEPIYGATKTPNNSLDFHLPEPSPSYSRGSRGSVRNFFTFARKVSFRTFGRSSKKATASYDLAGDTLEQEKLNTEHDAPRYAVSEKSDSEGEEEAVVMTTYRKLELSDLPDNDEKKSSSEPMAAVPDNIELVNYRELNTSTPYLNVNGKANVDLNEN